MPRPPRARTKTSTKPSARKTAAANAGRKPARPGKRRSTGPAAKRPSGRPGLVSIDELSEPQRASAFRAIEAALRQKGVGGKIAALHLTTDATRSTVLGLTSCRPGEVRRMVCRRNPTGVVVCGPRCVPDEV
jgi:hypothetical protein